MTKLMFVCHGNICRSPMAEFIMKKLVKEAGLEDEFEINSAAVSTEEIGSPVYPPARKELAKHGISCEGKYAVLLKAEDIDKYDLILVMDEYNLINISRIIKNDPQGKIYKLLEFAGSNKDVADPWYTRKFDVAYNDIEAGCAGLLEYLENGAGK